MLQVVQVVKVVIVLPWEGMQEEIVEEEGEVVVLVRILT